MSKQNKGGEGPRHTEEAASKNAPDEKERVRGLFAELLESRYGSTRVGRILQDRVRSRAELRSRFSNDVTEQ